MMNSSRRKFWDRRPYKRLKWGRAIRWAQRVAIVETPCRQYIGGGKCVNVQEFALAEMIFSHLPFYPLICGTILGSQQILEGSRK
jgi:hypothetical protein